MFYYQLKTKFTLVHGKRYTPRSMYNIMHWEFLIKREWYSIFQRNRVLIIVMTYNITIKL